MVFTHLPLGQSSLASPSCGVGLGFGAEGRGESLSPTDRKRGKGGDFGDGERDTI